MDGLHLQLPLHSADLHARKVDHAQQHHDAHHVQHCPQHKQVDVCARRVPCADLHIYACIIIQHTVTRTVTPTAVARKATDMMDSMMTRVRAYCGPTLDTLRQCGQRASSFVSVLNYIHYVHC